MNSDAKARLDALRKLLEEGDLSTQEELREKLEKLDFEVNQSTISRDLKKVGAVRATDEEGQTVYRLPEALEPAPVLGSLIDMVRSVETNGSIIVMHTAVGSAPFIARHLDRMRPGDLLGTIAGDDTIFVAPASTAPRTIKQTIAEIRESLAPGE